MTQDKSFVMISSTAWENMNQYDQMASLLFTIMTFNTVEETQIAQIDKHLYECHSPDHELQ